MKDGRYSRTAIALHWFIAVSIFFLFISSWWMLGLPLPSDSLRFREIPFQLHKNIGLTLFFVMFLLISISFGRRMKKEESAGIKPWMRLISRLGHVVLYLLIGLVCISGYLSSAHTRWDTTLWWLIDLPRIAAPDESLNQLFSDLHLWTAWLLLVTIFVHISGALYHAFRNDGVVRRMLRW
jgi:cytochrome b561